MARSLLLVALLSFGCWGSSDEREPARPGAAGSSSVAQATECTALDAERACVKCNGTLVPGTLLLLDGDKLWNPPVTSHWRLFDQEGDVYTWCRE